jgi:hypothetical protein
VELATGFVASDSEEDNRPVVKTGQSADGCWNNESETDGDGNDDGVLFYKSLSTSSTTKQRLIVL